MGEPINVGYVVLIGLFLFSVFLFLLWGQITNVKFVRLSALAIANFVKLFSPLIGGALESIFKTIIWF